MNPKTINIGAIEFLFISYSFFKNSIIFIITLNLQLLCQKGHGHGFFDSVTTWWMSFLIPLIGTVNRTYTQGAVRHKCIKLRLVRLTVFKNL